MKLSTKDQAEGKFYKMKGRILEDAGKISDNPKLEAEGTSERITGILLETVGKVKKFLESSLN